MSMLAAAGPDTRFRVRPAVLIGCGLLFAAAAVPFALSRSYYAQIWLLVVATIFVVLGWVLFLKCGERDATWRGWIALFTAVYLTASLPAFLIEFSPIRWFMRVHWAALYVRPWVHWGFIFVYLSVFGSLLGRGRSRVAFVLASVSLMILWESMGHWIY